MATEIVVNFRLDEHGRTTSTKAKLQDGSAEGVIPSSTNQLDYSSRAFMTNLQFPHASNVGGDHNSPSAHQQHQQWIDDLLFDCEISDSGLMPRTFWVPADGFTPRCALEQFALDVFRHHVPNDLEYDKEASGAEWWCQLRPSPAKTGRYTMHDRAEQDCEDSDNDSSGKPDPFTQGISFHVDKDEDLRILTGGTTYIHPHLSTVTYLTNFGSPTMIMDIRVHPLQGDWMVPYPMEGFVSWPACGKHISFDGRYLHAAPCDLMEEGQFEKQIQFQENSSDPKFNRLQTRRHRRVTFLVNIWLNFHPVDVKPFPETMLDKMSGSGNDSSERKQLQFMPTLLASKLPLTKTPTHIRAVTVTPQKATENLGGNTHTSLDESASYEAHHFSWALGDKRFNKETLKMDVPLQSIRCEADNGGNIDIKWDGETYSLTTHFNESHVAAALANREEGEVHDAPESRTVTSVSNGAVPLQGSAKRARVGEGG